VLPCVRRAEQALFDGRLDHEYAGIAGVPDFTAAALKLALGHQSAPIKEGRCAIVQAVSGTGALRTGTEFLVI
jgi:aspartate aminotransferase